MWRTPANILYKIYSGPLSARQGSCYRFIKNAYWDLSCHYLFIAASFGASGYIYISEATVSRSIAQTIHFIG